MHLYKEYLEENNAQYRMSVLDHVMGHFKDVCVCMVYD